MPGLYSKYIKLIHVVGDALVLTTASLGAFYMNYGNAVISSSYLLLILFSVIAWFICASLSGAYKFVRIVNKVQIIFSVSKVILLYILLVEATLNILNITAINRIFLNYYYPLIATFIVCWRLLINKILKEYRRRGFNYRNVIIVGYSAVGSEIMRFFKAHPEHGYRFFGFFDDKSRNIPDVIGEIADVETFVLENDIDEIYCSPFEIEKDQLKRLTEFVDNNLVRMNILPEMGEFPYKRLKVDFYDILPVLMLRSIPLDDAINKFIKRSFDIFFSSIVIIFVLSWLLPILALLVKLDSKGPVLFKQERSGIDNKVFNCLKIRTMFKHVRPRPNNRHLTNKYIKKLGEFV